MFVKADIRGIAVYLEITRPQRGNSLGVRVAEELLEALLSIERNLALADQGQDNLKRPRLLVLHCSTFFRKDGQAIWSAGGDLRELAELSTKGNCREFVETMGKICLLLESLPILVLAVVDGLAIGGAAEFALAADLRLVTPSGGFEFRQLEVGLPTGFGGGRRLLQLVGKSRAQRLLYFGEVVKGEDAVSQGLAHKIFDSCEDISDFLNTYLQKLGRMSMESVAAQKRIFLESDDERAGHDIDQFVDVWRNPIHEAFLSRFNKES